MMKFIDFIMQIINVSVARWHDYIYKWEKMGSDYLSLTFYDSQLLRMSDIAITFQPDCKNPFSRKIYTEKKKGN